jgi:hypothetical protein
MENNLTINTAYQPSRRLSNRRQPTLIRLLAPRQLHRCLTTIVRRIVATNPSQYRQSAPPHAAHSKGLFTAVLQDFNAAVSNNGIAEELLAIPLCQTSDSVIPHCLYIAVIEFPVLGTQGEVVGFLFVCEHGVLLLTERIMRTKQNQCQGVDVKD